MQFIKVYKYVINLEDISYVEFSTETEEVCDEIRHYEVAKIHLKGFEGRLFSGGMVAEEYRDNDPLQECTIHLFYEDARNLKMFFNNSSNVTLLD